MMPAPSAISKLTNIFRRAFSIAGIQAINIITPLLALPFIARALGIDLFGIYALLLAYGNTLILFSDYTFNVTGPLNVNKSLSEQRLYKYILESLKTKTALWLPASVAYIALSTFAGKADVTDAILGLILASTVTYTPRWIVYSLNRLFTFAVITAICRIAWLIAVIFLVKDAEDLPLVLYLSIAAQAGILLGSYTVIRPYWRNDRQDHPHTRASILPENMQFVALLARSSASEFNMMALPILSSITQVALFAVSDRVRMLMLGLVAPVTQALFLFTVQNQNKTEQDANRQDGANAKFFAIIIIVFTSSIGSVGVFLLADQIVAFLGGAEFQEASSVLRVLCALPPITAISAILGTNTLLVHGHGKVYANCQLTAATLCLPAAALLIYTYGAHGAAVSVVACEALLATLYLLQIFRNNLFEKVYN